MEDHAADQLHVEVAHADGALAGFADDGEGFGQNLVQYGLFFRDPFFGVVDAFQAGGDAGTELQGLGA